MWKFFKKYPTPDTAAQAKIDEVEDMIQPLGLSKRRSKALIQMSNDYIIKDWKKDPKQLYGIGKYASDSYQIFCVGEWRNVEPRDGALVNYHNFLKNIFNKSEQKGCSR
jgi:methyl-CpG-binding domain protein 4